MTVTRWDAKVMLRAVGLAALALVLGGLLTAVTDEGNVGLGERAGRTVPLAPLCAAIGVWGALVPVRSRGESLALQALGRTRGQVGAAAVVGGSAVALAAAALVEWGHGIGLAGFFPTATHAVAWRWHGGAFVDPSRGIRVGGDAAPVRLGGQSLTELAALLADPSSGAAASGLPPHARLAAALVTAAAGVALALLLADAFLAPSGAGGRARRRGPLSRTSMAVAALAITATIVLFQASAVHRAPAMLAVLPAALLLAFAGLRARAQP